MRLRLVGEVFASCGAPDSALSIQVNNFTFLAFASQKSNLAQLEAAKIAAVHFGRGGLQHNAGVLELAARLGRRGSANSPRRARRRADAEVLRTRPIAITRPLSRADQQCAIGCRPNRILAAESSASARIVSPHVVVVGI